VAAFGDQALRAELAGALEDPFAVAFDLLAVADRRCAFELSDQAFQRGFSLSKRDRAQILSIEVEGIEDIVDDRLIAPRGDRVLEMLEAGSTLWIRGNHLAVEDRALHRQAADGFRDARKRVRPVFSVAGHEAHLLGGLRGDERERS